MSYHRGGLRFLSHPVQVVCKIGTQWRGTHGSPVSLRTGAPESPGRGDLPRLPTEVLAQLNARHLPITAVRVSFKSAAETFAQRVLVQVPVRFENRCNRNGHFGVISVKPRP